MTQAHNNPIKASTTTRKETTMTSNKTPPRLIPDGRLASISDTEQYGLNKAGDRNEEMSLVLNAQTRFSALDAAEVDAYMIVVMHKTPDEDGMVSTQVEAGGTPTQKIDMLNTIVDVLNIQFYGNKEGKK